MSWWRRLFGVAKKEPAQTVAQLQETIRTNPELPDGYYGISALPDQSYHESTDHYQNAVQRDGRRDKVFFSCHWAFALKAAQAQYRGPCIDAFSRALIVDPARFASSRASIDSGNQFALAAWASAKEEPQSPDLLFPKVAVPPLEKERPAPAKAAAAEATSTAAGEPAAAAVEHDIRTCAHCGAKLRLPAGAAQKVRCPKCKNVIAVAEPAPVQTGTDIQAPPPSGDEYVDSCFRCDFKENAESRNWSDIKELKDIPSLYNAGHKDKALALVEAALSQFRDYHFVYSWLGTIRGDLKLPGEPEKSYAEGLRHSRSKASLCAAMAMAAFDKQSLAEAVKWWIRSCTSQLGGGRADDAYPFVNLAYVAEGLGMIGPKNQLLAWTEAIRPGGLMFNAEGANQRYRLASSQGNPSIKKAIELLCDFRPYAESMKKQHPTHAKAEEMKRLGDELMRQIMNMK